MSIVENRIINGFLKSLENSTEPEHLQKLLSQDVEIVAPQERAKFDDLWPAIWALASILERQLFGKVYIRCGLSNPLLAPTQLGKRCSFVTDPQPVALTIAIGTPNASGKNKTIVGDAALGMITAHELISQKIKPSPIECFLVAGYLGYSCLAELIGVPEYREEFAGTSLTINYDHELMLDRIKLIQGYTSIGLGQLGQAYLALLFFLHNGGLTGKLFSLVDKDSFEDENLRTQILLTETGDWLYSDKVDFIGKVVSNWGAEVVPHKLTIDWGWRKAPDDPALALVGLDDLEVRRMVCAAGFNQLIEAGVGTNLLEPRISWHHFSGDAKLGRILFPDVDTDHTESLLDATWVDKLKQTPGNCGWVRFQNISATAPCLGVAASAYALSELGNNDFVSGRACLWSPLIPMLREQLDY